MDRQGSNWALLQDQARRGSGHRGHQAFIPPDDDVSAFSDGLDLAAEAPAEFVLEDYLYDLFFCRSPHSRDVWEIDHTMDSTMAMQHTFEDDSTRRFDFRSSYPGDDQANMIKRFSAYDFDESTKPDDESVATLDSDVEETPMPESEFRYSFNDYQSRSAYGMEVQATIVPRKPTIKQPSDDHSDASKTIMRRSNSFLSISQGSCETTHHKNSKTKGASMTMKPRKKKGLLSRVRKPKPKSSE